jgi:hypothetical protein
MQIQKGVQGATAYKKYEKPRFKQLQISTNSSAAMLKCDIFSQPKKVRI